MHSAVGNHLESYLDGSLFAAPRRELEAHLRECASCRQTVEEARQTNEWMQALVADPVAPSPGFYARVRARVEAERTQVWPFWQLAPVFSRQLGFALLATFLMLGGYFLTLGFTESRNQAAVADLVLDAPAIRIEAPALTAADAQGNRQRVMKALMAPASRVEGD